jgi:hypothetical protein
MEQPSVPRILARCGLGHLHLQFEVGDHTVDQLHVLSDPSISRRRVRITSGGRNPLHPGAVCKAFLTLEHISPPDAIQCPHLMIRPPGLTPPATPNRGV